MSFHDQIGGYPPPREQNASQYPPPPGEEDNRIRAFRHQRGLSNGIAVALPPISPYDDQYVQQPNSPNGYIPDQRPCPSEAYRQPAASAPPPGSYREDRGYQQEYARTGQSADHARVGQAPDYGRGGQQSFSQSAPRQRTAIACRYCRRRKIRCSGFDQNLDGRCSNCQRFQQECIFTPVSSQAQAFVPAHTVYPNMRNMGIGPDGRPRPMYPQGPALFGAHGQPLPVQQPLPQNSPYEYPAPSPTGSYSSYGDERSSQPPQDQARKRPSTDPHPSILPPPIPVQSPFMRSDSVSRRAAIDDDLRLPPVTPTSGQSAANYSPGSSHSSHSNMQPLAPSTLPSISRTPPPRSSPGESRTDPMSLGNIMERRPNEIDRSMLGRLDRKA